MSPSSIRQARTQLSELIHQALAGEDVIIARAGKPVVKLVPIEQKPAQRQLGGWKGKFWMAEDFDQIPARFDECLP